MTIYYFDTYDGTELVPDEVGRDLPDLEAAKREAVRGLADLAKDTIPDAVDRKLSICVRDEDSHEILRTSLAFKLDVLRAP